MINEDLNNNGIPDWAEPFDRKAANKPLPVGEDNDFAYEYDRRTFLRSERRGCFIQNRDVCPDESHYGKDAAFL